MNRNALLFALIPFLVIAYLTSLPAGEIYKWIDKEGKVHFSDSPIDMPDSQAGKESTDFPSKSLRSKKDWTRENLNLSIQGCILGMVTPNLESYRQRAAKDGHNVNDEEIKKVESLLRPIFHKTCKCVMEEVSKRWDYEKFSTDPPEIKQFLEYLIEKKVCPLPVPPQQ